MGKTFGGAVAAIAFMVLGAPSASAATTVGQTAPNSASVAGLGGPTLIVQDQIAGSPAYIIPEGGGVITSWSVQGGTMPSYPVKLKLVTRDTDPTSFTFVSEDTQRPIAPGVLNTFETRIPVRGGELLALWAGAALEGSAAYFDAAPGDVTRFGSGPHQEPLIGESFQTDASLAATRVNVSAILEPDCDGDGFGDETQDSDLSSCDPNAPTATITKGPKDKTKKKTATFEFSGTDTRAIAGFQCSVDSAPFATCTSPHTVKVKKGKHTFEVRAVDQAGNVGAAASDAWKVKKKTKK